MIAPIQVVAYDETGKITGEAGRWEVRSADYRPDPSLVADIHELEFTHSDAFESWAQAGCELLTSLGADDEDRAGIAEFTAKKLLQPKPSVSTAHLASGSFVVASKPFAEFIRESNGNIHAGEMEAAGMMAAAEYRRAPVRSLVLRGISDHVDADKKRADAIGDGGLRRLAMDNAWRLLCLLMELGLIPRTVDAEPRS